MSKDGQEHQIVDADDPRLVECLGQENRDKVIPWLESGGEVQLDWRGMDGVRVLAGARTVE